MRGSNQKGKHVVTLKIVIPKQISEEEKAIYEQLKKVQQIV
jgi:DnaJ-class molecular chaperone